MIKLSANLGYLWPELDLLDAIDAATEAGFDAVEVHWPYITHALDVALKLELLQIPMISLNTVAGDLAQGDFGLAAVADREPEARSAIDKALAYAADTSCKFVHILAGVADGTKATQTYESNLRYASEKGEEFGVGVLIEPLNTEDNPGYFLNYLDQAAQCIANVGASNINILFDCYHTQKMEGGDVVEKVTEYFDLIGHVQIASVPDRGSPDKGEVDYPVFLTQLDKLGYDGYVGAEYKPVGPTAESLGWMETVRQLKA